VMLQIVGFIMIITTTLGRAKARAHKTFILLASLMMVLMIIKIFLYYRQQVSMF
jgi:hypothetical protein